MNYGSCSGISDVPSSILARMSLVLLLGRLGMMVRHRMSRKLGGLDIAICIF
jgi:hypothetical protein